MEKEEKKEIIDYCNLILNKKCESDFYYDNPSAAVDDLQFLSKTILKLLDDKF